MLRIACILIAACTFVSAVVVWKMRDPAVVFLADENGAQWIRHDEPFRLAPRRVQKQIVGFGKSIDVGAGRERAILHVRALRSLKVLVDGALVFSTPEDPVPWNQRHAIDLAPRLSPGRHEIALMVGNSTGPPSVLAYSEELGIRTGPDWEASLDGARWTAARSASQIHSSELSREFPRVDQAFFATLPVLGFAFLIVFWMVALRREGGVSIEPSVLRWFLLAAWALLGINNLVKLPLHLGFDAFGHMDYIRVIAEQHRLPLPTEGWMMFQAPLYYLISAPLYALGTQLFEPETVFRLLRLVPLACGLAAIEVVYRSLRSLWPADPGRQRVGLLFAALCPMGLYLSVFVGNEMLFALLLAAVLALTMRLLQDPAATIRRRLPLAIGVLLGLALLTKLTALALTPPVLVALAWASWRSAEGSSLNRARRAAITVAGVACIELLLAGWYYARNWIELGRLVWVGNEPDRGGIAWWQDPGYRTWGQLFRFGESLVYPIKSAAIGFPDGIHSSFSLDSHLSAMLDFADRPPWNYDFMLGGAWWGLVPVALMGIGLLFATRSENAATRRVVWFSGACLVVTYTAIIQNFLQVPYWCVIKATYTLGLLPCYAVLVAAGFGALARGRIARGVAYGSLACWGLSAYLAYFVI
ncbi:MAG TPA: glycosyltransferase family 39 protein [Myxococcota bacterium]